MALALRSLTLPWVSLFCIIHYLNFNFAFPSIIFWDLVVMIECNTFNTSLEQL